MLVLSRRPGESVVIGNDVVVTVLEVRGGQIRLGIDAPRNLQVHREEVYREVCRENEAAIASASRDNAILRKKVSWEAVQSSAPTEPAEKPERDAPERS